MIRYFIYKSLSEGSDFSRKSFTPFEARFKGKKHFLIDGNGKSTTGHILSIVKELNLATIIGEDLGSNHFCTGGQKRFKLTNTHVFYYVGHYTNISDAHSYPDDRGVMPDFFVTQNIFDYLNDIDTVLNFNFTIEMIKNARNE